MHRNEARLWISCSSAPSFCTVYDLLSKLVKILPLGDMLNPDQISNNIPHLINLMLIRTHVRDYT